MSEIDRAGMRERSAFELGALRGVAVAPMRLAGRCIRTPVVMPEHLLVGAPIRLLCSSGAHDVELYRWQQGPPLRHADMNSARGVTGRGAGSRGRRPPFRTWWWIWYALVAQLEASCWKQRATPHHCNMVFKTVGGHCPCDMHCVPAQCLASP